MSRHNLIMVSIGAVLLLAACVFLVRWAGRRGNQQAEGGTGPEWKLVVTLPETNRGATSTNPSPKGK